jgi:hypothetical protein
MTISANRAGAPRQAGRSRVRNAHEPYPNTATTAAVAVMPPA